MSYTLCSRTLITVFYVVNDVKLKINSDPNSSFFRSFFTDLLISSVFVFFTLSKSVKYGRHFGKYARENSGCSNALTSHFDCAKHVLDQSRIFQIWSFLCPCFTDLLMIKNLFIVYCLLFIV